MLPRGPQVCAWCSPECWCLWGCGCHGEGQDGHAMWHHGDHGDHGEAVIPLAVAANPKPKWQSDVPKFQMSADFCTDQQLASWARLLHA